MQQRRRGFTPGRVVATLAIGAVVVGGCLEALQMYQSRYLFQASASYYGKKEDEIRSAMAQGREIGPNCRYNQEMQTDLSPARVAAMQELADHYAALKQKYLLASSRPWKPVPPDPPLPEGTARK
ncbi:MAG: hypothetical protein ACLQIB_00735 [Isosphaeraceae bacterium]